MAVGVCWIMIGNNGHLQKKNSISHIWALELLKMFAMNVITENSSIHQKYYSTQSRIIREWPFDIYGGGQKITRKANFFFTAFRRSKLFFSKITILSMIFYKLSVRNKLFFSTKYRKQTFFLAKSSGPPHKYQMAAPLASSSVTRVIQVRDRYDLLAQKGGTLPVCYQLVPTSADNGFTKCRPCVIMSMW